jgi:hypothetical protein
MEKSPVVAIEENVRSPVPLLVTETALAELVVPTRSAPNTMEEADRETFPVTPLPVTGMVCGLPTASSATDSTPETGTARVGEKVTSMRQLIPAPSVAPQALCREKPGGTEMSAIVTTLELLFVKVTLCVAVSPVWTSPKLKEFGEKTTSTPVPDNGTVCGLPRAEPVIVSSPVLGPALAGVKVTETLHVRPGVIVVQVFRVENSELAEIPAIVIATIPVLRKVTLLATLVVFTD